MSTDQPAPALAPATIPVFALFERNPFEHDVDFMGLYPSPDAAKAYVAALHHGPVSGEWEQRPTVEGEPDIYVLRTASGFWQVSQFKLERDGTPAFDEAVLRTARSVVARRFGLPIAGHLMRLLDRAAANVNADTVP